MYVSLFLNLCRQDGVGFNVCITHIMPRCGIKKEFITFFLSSCQRELENAKVVFQKGQWRRIAISL